MVPAGALRRAAYTFFHCNLPFRPRTRTNATFPPFAARPPLEILPRVRLFDPFDDRLEPRECWLTLAFLEDFLDFASARKGKLRLKVVMRAMATIKDAVFWPHLLDRIILLPYPLNFFG